jgi:hypothetical protein
VGAGNRLLRTEYFRLYDARGEPSRPNDESKEQPMLGRSRFYEPELLDARRRFMEAARDLRFALADDIM